MGYVRTGSIGRDEVFVQKEAEVVSIFGKTVQPNYQRLGSSQF